MPTPLEAAQALLAEGYLPVPVPWKQKAPLLDGWSRLRLTAETVGQHFGSAPQNVGVLLGQLADVDCDAPEAIAAAPDFLPATPRIHGRPSKPRSHWWYRRERAQPTLQFRNTDATMLVELRGEGGHTLVPPSVHPFGEALTYESAGDPALVDGDALERAVARLAAVALLARHWPKQPGSRHQLALGLAGFLLRGDLEADLCERLIGSAARIAQDPERRDRVQAVRTTAARLAAGEDCVASIERLIPDGAVLQGLLTRWLRLRVPHPRLTDLGNAERFVAQHGEDARFVYAFRSWFVWNGQRWWKDPGDAIARLAKASVRSIYAEAAAARDPDDRKQIVAWATRSESADRVKAMLELAKSEVAVLPDAFDRDPYLLNCPNGTLELRTEALRPHRRDDLITKLTAAPYDPAARHPLWDAFLDRVLPDEALRTYMQRLAGYCLTGDTREEQWWLLFGPTLSGKTTWTAALEKTGGDYAITVDFQTFAVQKIESSAPREDIARLHGPRLVVSSEVRKGMRLSEGLIKQFTGGDVLTAHRKYEHMFEFVPRCKLMVAANYRPRVRDDDSAIWRRIVEVPFTESITDPDPSIKAALTDPTKAGPGHPRLGRRRRRRLVPGRARPAQGRPGVDRGLPRRDEPAGRVLRGPVRVRRRRDGRGREAPDGVPRLVPAAPGQGPAVGERGGAPPPGSGLHAGQGDRRRSDVEGAPASHRHRRGAGWRQWRHGTFLPELFPISPRGESFQQTSASGATPATPEGGDPPEEIPF